MVVASRRGRLPGDSWHRWDAAPRGTWETNRPLGGSRPMFPQARPQLLAGLACLGRRRPGAIREMRKFGVSRICQLAARPCLPSPALYQPLALPRAGQPWQIARQPGRPPHNQTPQNGQTGDPPLRTPAIGQSAPYLAESPELRRCAINPDCWAQGGPCGSLMHIKSFYEQPLRRITSRLSIMLTAEIIVQMPSRQANSRGKLRQPARPYPNRQNPPE